MVRLNTGQAPTISGDELADGEPQRLLPAGYSLPFRSAWRRSPGGTLPALSRNLAQGAECAEVLYLQQGSVKLSVLSPEARRRSSASFNPGTFSGKPVSPDSTFTSPRLWQ